MGGSILLGRDNVQRGEDVHLIRHWIHLCYVFFALSLWCVSLAYGQCADAQCDDGLCQPECQECQVCAECQSPEAMQRCGMGFGPGHDGGPPGSAFDADVPIQNDAGPGEPQAQDAGAPDPPNCMGARCGDGICAAECGECAQCDDCLNEDQLCQRQGEFDFTDCLNGAYYDRLGFPEVSLDGGGCSQRDCPSFEDFCAVPEHRGVGVTGCSRGMPCGQPGRGGGTPMQCDCGDGEEECRERDVQPDECQTDCDCIGSENGGRCLEDPVCGNICSLRCLNRNRISFPDGAFSSCEFPCPTTRAPAADNPGSVHIDDVPAHCLPGTNACPNPDAPSLVPPGTQQDHHDSCKFYLQVRACLNDCGACETNRLEGYYAICSNARNLANWRRPAGLPAEYFSCGGEAFQTYADGMMFCLQAKAADYMSQGCRSCNDIVSGMPGIDIESGIIGAHSECNETNGFCQLTRAQGFPPLKCFGAAMGRAWGSILGHHSPLGALQPVGVCHLMSQLLACARGNPFSLHRWHRQLCEGYVDGCMSRPFFGNLFPDAEIPILGTNIRDIIQRKICEATCPQFTEAALIGLFDIGVDGALEFERQCNGLLTEGLSIFGYPVFPGLDDLGIPGTGSGRDPCLTY